MCEDQRKHLEFLQGVISRMAGNSFLLRGWSVTLVAALFALAAKDADRSFVVISYFPCIMLWILDAYYLSQERKFRSLYDSVRSGANTDFNMSTEAAATWEDSWPSSLLSLTPFLFHGTMLGVISIAMV